MDRTRARVRCTTDTPLSLEFASDLASGTVSAVALDPPTFTKAFSPDVIVTGGISTLTFTIDSTMNLLAIGNLDFTDTLPAGVTVAATPNASTTCTGGVAVTGSFDGTVDFDPGPETVDDLSMGDDLAAVFGTHGVDWTFTSISSVPASFTDPAFNGHSDTELVVQAPSQSLLSGQVASVTVTLQLLTFNAAVAGSFDNQVTAAGTTLRGAGISDLSADDADPDPNGDGDPSESGIASIAVGDVPVTLREFTVE